MKSPFPGMDPYIESPYLWRGFHHLFISETTRELNRILPPEYVAAVDERVYVIPPQHSIYADVTLVRREGEMPPQSNSARSAPGRGASDATTLVIAAYPEETTEGFIEVRTAAPEGVLVTVLELLSPTNKAFGTAGWTEYRSK